MPRKRYIDMHSSLALFERSSRSNAHIPGIESEFHGQSGSVLTSHARSQFC